MRKKLLAVVLCVMTTVAFMPTFAFAVNTEVSPQKICKYKATWAEDYSSVTVEKAETEAEDAGPNDFVWSPVGKYDAERSWNQENGSIVARVPVQAEEPEWWESEEWIDDDWVYGNYNPKNGVRYYDLNGAALVDKTEAAAPFIGEFDDAAAFKNYVQPFGDMFVLNTECCNIKLEAPDYVTGYEELPVKSYVTDLYLADMYTEDFDADSTEEQSFVLMSEGNDDTIGSFEHPVKINATKQYAKDAKFYLDGQRLKVNGEEDIDIIEKGVRLETEAAAPSDEYANYRIYDGKSHPIVMVAAEGVEAEYAVRYVEYNKAIVKMSVNPKPVKTFTTQTPAVKDAGFYEFVVTLKDAAGHKYIRKTIDIEVGQRDVIARWKADSSGNRNIMPYRNDTLALSDYVDYDADYARYYNVEAGTEIDPFDYIEVIGYGDYYRSARGSLGTMKKYYGEFELTKEDAGLFREFAEKYLEGKVTALPKASTELYDIAEISFTPKHMTGKEETALMKEYASLNNNYNLNDIGMEDLLYKALVYVKKVQNTKANEVEFNAIDKKVYHVKKAKSLKKTRSITVKAEALSGVAPTYKLINANKKIKINKNSGKITVKKGLKKGTYKISIKATVQAGFGYTAASETHNLTIRVKK